MSIYKLTHKSGFLEPYYLTIGSFIEFIKSKYHDMNGYNLEIIEVIKWQNLTQK